METMIDFLFLDPAGHGCAARQAQATQSERQLSPAHRSVPKHIQELRDTGPSGRMPLRLASQKRGV